MIAIYNRVSSPAQAENYSIKEQKEEGVAFAKSKGEDFELFIDIWSGKDVSRENWRKMIKGIEENRFSAIWCAKLDRLSRNALEGLKFLEALQQSKTKLFVKEQEQDLNDPAVEFMLILKFGLSQLEVRTINNRTKEKLHKWIDDGEKRFRCIYGYRTKYTENGKKYRVIHENEADVIKKVYSLYKEGYSYTYIARYLNDNGFTTYEDKLFSDGTISNILKRPEYSGHSCNTKNELIKSKVYDAIITLEDFQMVQHLIDKNNNNLGRNWKIKLSYSLLSGIIRCPKCNATYYYFKKPRKLKNGETKHTYYYKHNQHRTEWKDCENLPKNIKAHILDDIVTVLYINTFQDFKELKSFCEQYKKTISQNKTELQEARDRLEKLIEEIDNEKNRILDAVQKGVFSPEDIASRVTELNKSKEEYTKKIKDAEQKCLLKSKDIYKILDRFSAEELDKFFNSENTVKRKMLTKILSSTIENNMFEVKFITGRTITIDLDNIPAWLGAQIDSLNDGTYTPEYIENIRNTVEEFQEELRKII